MATAISTSSAVYSDSLSMSSTSSSESEGEFEYTDKKSVDKYECIICHNIIKDYIELPCGHIGCQRCVKKWGQTTYKLVCFYVMLNV